MKIGLHYLNGNLEINLNKIFFKDIYETSNIEIGVDGFLILNKNIEDSLTEKTLEQIHNLYNKHGIHLVEKIKTGRFNLVILDKIKKKLFLVSDYFGKIPVYYTDDGEFQFSSNIKNLPGNSIDWVGLSQYLKYSFMLGDRTQYGNIKVSPPHSVMEYDIKNKKKKLYSYKAKPSVATDDVEKLFKQACNRLYTDKLDYVISLSGGIDSRFVLYHWKNKKDLIATTGYLDAEGELIDEDVQIAKKFLENIDVKKHVINKSVIMNVNQLNEKLDKYNPFDVKKIKRNVTKPTFDRNVILGGHNGPVLSGEYMLLRHRLFILTLLTGHQFKTVSASIYNKGISKTPDDVKEYMSEFVRKNFISFPLDKDRYNVEHYHLFNKIRRITDDRKTELLEPFSDWDVYLNCKNLKNRVNNKIYYNLIQKMPREYKEVRVTRYSYPLIYPRRLQYLSMIIKDVKRNFVKQDINKKEGIGGLIEKKSDLMEYMVKTIEEADTCSKIGSLTNKVSGGKYGQFFYLLFILSYWFKNEVQNMDVLKNEISD